MKLIIAAVALFIIGSTQAGSPSYNPFSSSAPLTCDEIEFLVNQLSEDAREALKTKILHRPRLLDLVGNLGGNIVGNVLSGLLSSLNILNLDKVFLNNILGPTVVTGKNELDLESDPTWSCLVNLFESE